MVHTQFSQESGGALWSYRACPRRALHTRVWVPPASEAKPG